MAHAAPPSPAVRQRAGGAMAGKGAPSEMLPCQDCGAEFPRKGRFGPAPKRCPACTKRLAAARKAAGGAATAPAPVELDALPDEIERQFRSRDEPPGSHEMIPGAAELLRPPRLSWEDREDQQFAEAARAIEAQHAAEFPPNGSS
jgi:hypothetical protein